VVDLNNGRLFFFPLLAQLSSQNTSAITPHVIFAFFQLLSISLFSNTLFFHVSTTTIQRHKTTTFILLSPSFLGLEQQTHYSLHIDLLSNTMVKNRNQGPLVHNCVKNNSEFTQKSPEVAINNSRHIRNTPPHSPQNSPENFCFFDKYFCLETDSSEDDRSDEDEEDDAAADEDEVEEEDVTNNQNSEYDDDSDIFGSDYSYKSNDFERKTGDKSDAGKSPPFWFGLEDPGTLCLFC
jgi:hypothetical protein